MGIIIIAFVVLSLGLTLFYFIRPFFRRLAGSSQKLKVNSQSDLTDQQYRMLAVGAIYGQQQGAYVNSLKTGIPKMELRMMLHKLWDVKTSSEAIDTLNMFLDNVRNPTFPVVIQAYKNDDTSIVECVFAEDEERRERAYWHLENLRESFEVLQGNEIVKSVEQLEATGPLGWEAGRLVLVARMCADIRFISEREAWEYIEIAADLARDNFQNWSEFGSSYIIGRTLAMGEDMSFLGITEIVKYLQTEPESPWVKFRW